MRLTFSEIQRNVTEIANRPEYEIDVLYELMAAYGRSASSITKLRNGIINLADNKETTILQRGVVYLKHVSAVDSLPAEVEKIEQDPLTARYNPRFLIATDFKMFAAKDTKKGTTLEISWEDIDRNVDFFYGWTGDEVTDEKTEAVADRRAADKMKELYYEIEKINRDKLAEKGSTFRHDLNVFFTRLLFSFFAEDTQVFSKENQSIFTSAIKDYTQTDGSDLDQFLSTMFNALDSEDKSGFTSPFSNFPYVNGTLFDTTRNIAIPKFNAQARKYILDCGSLNWSEINPDIFGSMFQSIVDEDQRATHGQHYTSVPNIMKTIEPLFLDELREEFDKYYDNLSKLSKLHNRIAKIKVFDPACGSGNFLIIAYKELRKLEHAIIDRLYEDNFKKAALAGRLSTRIDLDNFYGIEIDDFACEVAVLSLYLAKHQMNIEFEKQFGKEIKLIPLKDKANIVRGNAAQLDWQQVCPNVQHTTEIHRANEQSALIKFKDDQPELKLGEKYWNEIYLISNPPYLGQRNQRDSHKNDLAHVFDDTGKYKKLDYVSCWIIKASEYIGDSHARSAFITTDSICQGVQVGQLWPRVIAKDVEIIFAYSSFKWKNSAKDNAGVSCVVIGLSSISNSVKEKYLYSAGTKRAVRQINPYLTEGDTIILQKHNEPISTLPKMVSGNQPREGGYLMLDGRQKDELLSLDHRVEKFIKPMLGADELIKGKKRWCIWIDDEELETARSIPVLRERIESVRKHRVSGNSVEKSFANVPHKFVTSKRPRQSQIVLPSVSSEGREYIPIAIYSRNEVITSSCFCIFDSGLEIFSILNSLMHVTWVKAVTGRLETRINYASNTCYNAFPIRKIKEDELKAIQDSARAIIFARENHSEKTLADMYDPGKMPEDLREAHRQNDILVDRLYRQKPYENDGERLADLFALYKQMTEKENK
jgi:type I restriction-modification system DNA methylase subunit